MAKGVSFQFPLKPVPKLLSSCSVPECLESHCSLTCGILSYISSSSLNFKTESDSSHIEEELREKLTD